MNRLTTLIIVWFTAIFSVLAQPFAGGNGTKANPFQISTPVQLDSIRHYLDKSFILLNDIDLDVAPYNTGEGWQPIGDYDNPFCGTLNGAGHAIKNLYILKLTGNYTGYALFCNTNNANILNLGLENCNVNAFFQPSTLISNSENDTIIGCYSTGNVITSGTGCGGLVCNLNAYCLMQNCYSTCNLSSYGGGGGLGLFCADFSTVNNCFATGDINCTPNPYTGGLFGIINRGMINNCYSTGNINGGSSVGGFVGYQTFYSNITNCYSTGKVKGINEVGGFLGVQLHSSSVNNCFYNKETSGFSDNDKGNPQTTAEMKKQSTFSGWDFSSTWSIREDCTYPALKSLNNAPFAFPDSYLKVEPVKVTDFLKNDFDIETKQSALCMKITRLFGANANDSANWFTNSGSFVVESTDSLYYRVGEIISAGDTLWGNAAMVKIVNRPPVASDMLFNSMYEDFSICFYIPTLIINNCSDPDGDSVLFDTLAPDFPKYGKIKIEFDCIYYYPDTNWNGTDSVAYIVTDGDCSDTAYIIVVVNPINDAPVITSAAPVQATENILYTYVVETSDVDGDTLTYSLSNAPSGMEITGNIVSWTPGEGITTSGEVTLTVNDGALADTETFTITVANVNSVNSIIKGSFSIFPNPVTDELFIEFAGDENSVITFEILDTDGKIIITKPFNSEENQDKYNIDVSSLSSGLYFCRINYSGYSEIVKIVRK